MFKKLVAFVLLINVLQPIMVFAQQAQEHKNTNSFAPTAGVAATTTGALCAAAGYSLSKENPYIAGGLLLASAATPLAVGKLAEVSKNQPLTVQESFQLGFADFFTTVGASALLMYFFPEKSWLKGGLLALCAAKCAYLLWRAHELPESTLEEESAGNTDGSQKPSSPLPQEAKFITPISHAHKTSSAAPEKSSTYPWFGGDKPDHKDAFVLMGN